LRSLFESTAKAFSWACSRLIGELIAVARPQRPRAKVTEPRPAAAGCVDRFDGGPAGLESIGRSRK